MENMENTAPANVCGCDANQKKCKEIRKCVYRAAKIILKVATVCAICNVAKEVHKVHKAIKHCDRKHLI